VDPAHPAQHGNQRADLGVGGNEGFGVGALRDLVALFNKPQAEQYPGKRLRGFHRPAVMTELDGAMPFPRLQLTFM
jgi:hypothetical protein